MTTTEAIVQIILASLVIGALAGAILVDIFSVRPLQKKLTQERSRRRYDRRVAQMHQGTPYLRPGLRLVDGESMYSADFLNDRHALLSDEANDGPAVSELKAILRGDAR